MLCSSSDFLIRRKSNLNRGMGEITVRTYKLSNSHDDADACFVISPK